MLLPASFITLQFNQYTVQPLVPQPIAVQQWHQQQLNRQVPTHVFPYWAKIWPAAKALTQFLADHPLLLKNKQVLELSAGIGLPSLLAAQIAQQVTCTDYVPEPLAYVTEAAKQHTNFTTAVLNWNSLPKDLSTDVLLLSDVNYEPASFEPLLQVIHRFLQQGTTIIISTPQRLIAKPFIDALQPFCMRRQEIVADEVFCTVLVLKNQPPNP
jgi:predicted nicotinamide N-methyase